jgi:hypothetical protein
MKNEFLTRNFNQGLLIAAVCLLPLTVASGRRHIRSPIWVHSGVALALRIRRVSINKVKWLEFPASRTGHITPLSTRAGKCGILVLAPA